MTQKFVIRLLDAADVLLAWAEVYATARPQDRGGSCPFWAPGATPFRIDQTGVVARLSVHWCDLDVARVQAVLEPVPVVAGQTFAFAWMEPVWLVPGMRDVPLPAVTVGQPVAVVVPVGSVNAVAQ